MMLEDTQKRSNRSYQVIKMFYCDSSTPTIMRRTNSKNRLPMENE
jgi:hypothetical protein